MNRIVIISLLAAAVAAILAERKGRDWVSWTLATIIFPFTLLLLISMPALPRPGVSRKCLKCGGIMGVGQPRCPNCGQETPIELVECPGCKRFVTTGSKCPECGTSLS